MLMIVSIILILVSLVFGLSTVIMGLNIRRMRTPRAKKRLLWRCIGTGCWTVLLMAGGILLLLQSIRPMRQAKSIRGDAAYDINDTYKTTLSAAGEEKAYPLLPSSVSATDGTVALRNDRGDWFVYEETENSDGEITYRWVNRGMNTVRYQTVTMDDETLMTIHLGQDGRLYVTGQFPYMKFDVNSTVYDGVLAKNVQDFFCTGNTLFYLTKENTLYAVGFNEYGQLGDSSNRHKSTPVLVREDIVQVWSGANHTMMVDVFGNLYSVGDNSDSQLGDGTMNNTVTPVRIMAGVAQVAVGNNFSVVMAQNGEVYTCGRTNWGQCGNGSKNGTAKPMKIGSDAIKVVASDNGAAYMTKNGKVYAWGKNTDQCFVKEDTEFLNTPTLVAENAYDIALTEGSLIVLDRERDIQVTGKLRPEQKKYAEAIFTIDAKVPKDFVAPVQEEEKPDISELGKEKDDKKDK